VGCYLPLWTECCVEFVSGYHQSVILYTSRGDRVIFVITLGIPIQDLCSQIFDMQSFSPSPELLRILLASASNVSGAMYLS
jgi:hypothetical protein